MHNLSMKQALDVWSELETALHGTNGYGGDVAEIYVYRYSSNCPSLLLFLQDPERWKGTVAERGAVKDLETINTSFYSLLSHFEAARDAVVDCKLLRGPEGCVVAREESMMPPKDDGWRRLGEWVKKAGFSHRVHVRVRKI